MTESLKSQYQRPEGKLVEQAMKAQSPKVSGRALAEQVGLSEGRVRQIVNGYKTEGGSVIEIVAPTDTLARIADQLSISADDMEAAGRADVAEQLRSFSGVGITEEGDLWITDNSREIAALQAWIEAGEDNTPPPTSALGLWDIDQLLSAVQTKHDDEIRLLNYLVHAMRKDQKGGDGHAEADAGGSASTSKSRYDLAADEDYELTPEDEAEQTETST